MSTHREINGLEKRRLTMAGVSQSIRMQRPAYDISAGLMNGTFTSVATPQLCRRDTAIRKNRERARSRNGPSARTVSDRHNISLE